MIEIEVVFILLAVCAVLVFQWCIATEFGIIAEHKGYTDKKYFWWCFWFTFAGYAMVIALPDRGNELAEISSDELPEL